jgi:hypothetical protein
MGLLARSGPQLCDKGKLVLTNLNIIASKSGAVVEWWTETQKYVGSSHGDAVLDFDSFVGKLTENCRKTPSCENKNRRKVPLRFEIFHLHCRNSSD